MSAVNKSNIFVLIIGLMLGAGGVYTHNSLQISQLNEQIQQLHSVQNKEIGELEAQNQQMANEYDSLLGDYSELEQVYQDIAEELNGVNEEFQSLQSAYDLVDKKYSELEIQNHFLETEDLGIQSLMADLNNTYQALLEDYQNLLSEYNMINGSSSRMITLNDLEINLTTDRTIYNYTDPVEGTISIYYKNGEPFEGEIGFSVIYETGRGYSAWYHNTYGETRFYLTPPVFVYGPGQYTIALNIIRDSGGFIIAESDSLRSLNINVLVI